MQIPFMQYPITLPLRKASPAAGPRPSPPGGGEGAQASHFDVKTPLAGENPLTPMPPAGGNFSATLPKGQTQYHQKTGFDNLVRSDFHMDSWQDCRKSTN